MEKLLFLTTDFPYPAISGGKIKTFKLLQAFAGNFELSLVNTKGANDAIGIAGILDQLKLHRYYFGEIKKGRSAVSWLKSLFSGKTINEWRNHSPHIEKIVRDWSLEADIIFVDHLEMYQYVPSNFQGKVVLHQHNTEYMLWRGVSASVNNPLISLPAYIESFRVKNKEGHYAKKCDLVMGAPDDLMKLSDLGVNSHQMTPTFHLGEDGMLNRSKPQYNDTSESLLFVGTLSWDPNVRGLVWFFKKVWDNLKIAHPRLKMYVVGKDPSPELLRYFAWDDVHHLGYVEDLEELYTRCRVFIAPLLYGSGMKVKILNAMYRGIPVVTTPSGIESLNVQDGLHMLVAYDPDDFRLCIMELLNSKETWELMQEESRTLADRMYRWDDLLRRHIVDLSEL